MSLNLDSATRAKLWQRVVEILEDYERRVHTTRVMPELDPQKIRALLEPIDFARPVDPIDAVNFVAGGLWQYQTHVAHPRYYGLFNPAPTTMGIVADALVAGFNPQLAAWCKSPFSVEIESHLVRAFATRFGYDAAGADGTFASGGAEANHTGLLAALAHAFPGWAKAGVRELPGQPVLYVSSEAHHSFQKAARLSGLGADAVRLIPVDARLRMDLRALASRIALDKADGFAPFLVVATAGSTSAGVVDPIARIADIAASEGLWLHVDAAWGGAAVLIPELREVLDGIERADSITFDAHKWLSVPMGAGLFLTRHPDILERAFRVTSGGYMPRDAAGLEVMDPFAHSMQWSRRFIGLKLFLSLMVAGWDGYEETLRHQVAMGCRLREQLEKSGWEVVSDTALPLVCFVDRQHPRGTSAAYLEEVARKLVTAGKAWLSVTRVGDGIPVLRACITNYRTMPDDIDALVRDLNEAR